MGMPGRTQRTQPAQQAGLASERMRTSIHSLLLRPPVCLGTALRVCA
jgi:hypothetical protein